MVFTSPIFIFLFLPITLAVSFLLPRPLKNPWLLVASIVFYAWGEMLFAVVMVGSILVNYGMALWIARGRSWPVLAIAVGLNVAPLFVMKYGNFAVANW